MGAPAQDKAQQLNKQLGGNVYDTGSYGVGATNPRFNPDPSAFQPTFINPVNADDYQMADLRGTGAGRDYLAQQQANYDAFSEAAMRQAAQQALTNTRGIGNQYGSMGAANSGAAIAAAAQGANAPLIAAQTAMAQQRQQGLNEFYDRFTGTVAPQYIQQASPVENAATLTALQESQRAS